MTSVENVTELSVQGESLQRLYNQYVTHRFLVNRRYQRKLVWSTTEKAKLVDSVLQRLPIPLILLAETPYDDMTRLEVIDGLQRMNAIFAFIENEYDVDGHFFDLETLADTKYARDQNNLVQKEPRLDREACRDFANYQLPVSTYRSASESSVDEVFRRINSSGRHLSLQEIRQAGSTVEIAGLVRRISAAIRGDSSLTEYVKLEDMPNISITSESGGRGVYDAEIFWVKQGILSREAVRESRDEELVLDILLDLILSPLPSSGSEYRNAAYGDDRGASMTSATNVRSRLRTVGADEIEKRFMQTLDVVLRTLEEAEKPYSSWTVKQQNPRGVPRHFHALFVAIAQLMYDESLAPESNKSLALALQGFWDRDLSIPGGGNWGGERKAGLINSVKGNLRPHFKQTTDQHQRKTKEQALQFESTLRMALTEDALFELKQGFCKLDDPQSLDPKNLARVLRAASAMANTRAGAKGVIFFGVADGPEAAAKIARFTGVEPYQLDRFYITGTQHELDGLGRSIDAHFRWLNDAITHSALEPTFARRLAKTLMPFRYRERLLWKLEPSAGAGPVTYEGKFFERNGPQTVAVTDSQALIDLVRRFPT